MAKESVLILVYNWNTNSYCCCKELFLSYLKSQKQKVFVVLAFLNNVPKMLEVDIVWKSSE